MKTTRISIIVLTVVALLGLAFWVQRQGKQAGVAGQPGAAVSSEAPEEGLDPAKPEVAGVAREEVTPELIETLTTATAQVVRGDGRQVDVRSIDGEFDRLLVDPNERLKIRVALRGFDVRRPVLVEADNGGSLNQRVGPLVLQPAAGDGAVEFDFAIGGNTGRYTLLVSQDGRQERMEFRAGPEPPTGQGGPSRNFNPERT